VPLREGRLTGWVRMTFRIGRSKVRGITMFCLTLDGTDPVLYCTALNVDPYYPVVPVSRPVHYSRYLAGMHGPFATLGLAEDTWALNNSIIGEDVFLEQAWSIFEERKRMFFDAMDRRGTGLVVCVFDTSDRIQHMFWSQGTGKGSVIRDMYARMDALLGETVGRLRKRDRLIVMSDHGFTSFSTCVDWNRWLVEEGYMVLEEGTDSIPTGFHGVDWSRTRAYSIGLAGIYLNLRGREARGTVNPGDEASELLDEMSERLLALVTPNGNRVVRSVSRADRTYRGPYAADGPDLVPGTEAGFRTGWNCATGGVGPEVLYENNLHWDGDHCHDRTLVPGILVTSWKHGSESPEIMDIAPTALRMLGVEPPGWMDGTPLAPEDDVEPA
jgi:predicted AlkP superfamily phosphohydrolase/phosphomutase